MWGRPIALAAHDHSSPALSGSIGAEVVSSQGIALATYWPSHSELCADGWVRAKSCNAICADGTRRLQSPHAFLLCRSACLPHRSPLPPAPVPEVFPRKT
jgi:hypothetical protein